MSNISRHYEKSSPLPAGYEGSSPQKWYTDSGAALLSCVWVDLCGDFRIMEERRELQPSTKHRSLYHDDHWHREPPESAELRLMSKNTEKMVPSPSLQPPTGFHSVKRNQKTIQMDYVQILMSDYYANFELSCFSSIENENKKKFYATFYATLLGHLWKHFRIVLVFGYLHVTFAHKI